MFIQIQWQIRDKFSKDEIVQSPCNISSVRACVCGVVCSVCCGGGVCECVSWYPLKTHAFKTKSDLKLNHSHICMHLWCCVVWVCCVCAHMCVCMYGGTPLKTPAFKMKFYSWWSHSCVCTCCVVLYCSPRTSFSLFTIVSCTTIGMNKLIMSKVRSSWTNQCNKYVTTDRKKTISETILKGQDPSSFFLSFFLSFFCLFFFFFS